MLSQKLCEPLFLYKWNLYDHLTDVSIDDSGSHIRELYKLKLKAFLGYFFYFSEKQNWGSVSCELFLIPLWIQLLILQTSMPNVNGIGPSYKSSYITLSMEEIMSTPWPSSGNVRWVNISLPLQDLMSNNFWKMELDGWFQTAKHHSQNLRSVVS